MKLIAALFLLSLPASAQVVSTGITFSGTTKPGAKLPELCEYQAFKSTAVPGCTANGHWQTKKVGNRWILADPHCHAFWSVGIQNLGASGSVDQADSTYGNNHSARVQAIYGGLRPWASVVLRRAHGWGFNTIAHSAGSGFWSWETPTPSILMPTWVTLDETLRSLVNENSYASRPIKDLYAVQNPSVWVPPTSNGLPDFYDSEYQSYVHGHLVATAADPFFSHWLTDPYVIGISMSDQDYVQTGGVGYWNDPLLDAHDGVVTVHTGWIALSAAPKVATDAPTNQGTVQTFQTTEVFTKTQMVSFLQGRYAAIGDLNTAWGSDYTQFASTGTQFTNVALSGSGTGPYTATLNTTVSKRSIFVKDGTTTSGGDNPVNSTLRGSGISSGTINYTTGAISVTYTSTPTTPQVDYVQNGWGIGTGLADEDGRHTTWMGSTNIGQIRQGGPGVDAEFKIDMDAFLTPFWNNYTSIMKTEINEHAPNKLVISNNPINNHGGLSRKEVIQAFCTNSDIIMAGMKLKVSITPPSNAGMQAMIDKMEEFGCDKPYLPWEGWAANRDSGLWDDPNRTPDDCEAQQIWCFSSQAARAAEYSNSINWRYTATTAAGKRPFIGIAWWTWVDNWGEGFNLGLVSVLDNSYDGREDIAVAGTNQFDFPIGREDQNWGNFLDTVESVNIGIQRDVELSFYSGPAAENAQFALNRPVLSSSDFSSSFPARFAVDGNGTTRWSSAFSDPQWLRIDLRWSHTIGRVVVKWSVSACAATGNIQTSDDGTTWVNQATISNATCSPAQTNTFSFTPVVARYVRLLGKTRVDANGYSPFEVEVYEQ